MPEVAVVLGLGEMGIAIARRVASGRRIVLADRNSDLVSSRVRELADGGFDVTGVPVDVSDGGAVRALAGEAASLGSVQVVAHTAGVSPVDSSVEAILAVDLVGTAWVLEAFGQVIGAGGSAVVITSMAAALFPPAEAEVDRAFACTLAADLGRLVAEQAGRFTDPGTTYAIAKQANIGRVAAEALRWGARGARVNAISPGVISTAMGRAELDGPSGEVMRMLIDRSAARRLGTPEDIADAAAFLLGPHASYVTGTNLLVDGGVCAGVRYPGETGS